MTIKTSSLNKAMPFKTGLAALALALGAGACSPSAEELGESPDNVTATSSALTVGSIASWPTVPAIAFGTLTFAQNTKSTLFLAPTGPLQAAIAPGPDAGLFLVTNITTYTVSEEEVDTSGDLPPSKGPRKRPPPVFQYVLTPHRQVNGPGPITVETGEAVSIAVTHSGAYGYSAANLQVNANGSIVKTPISITITVPPR